MTKISKILNKRHFLLSSESLNMRLEEKPVAFNELSKREISLFPLLGGRGAISD
jgi:hypothetical protein